MEESFTKRVFLGWEKPLVAESVNWLIQHYPEGFENLVIGVPGGRAGWQVRELLATSEAKTLIPPKVVTAGRLPEELINFDLPPASPFLQSIAWKKALEEIRPESLRSLTLFESSDDGVGTAFVNEIFGLYRELAGEGYWFSSLEEHLPQDMPDKERFRWQALAEAEQKKDDFLAHLGFCDPQNTRQPLIESDCINTDLNIVLVGVPDSNDVLRKLIDKIPHRVTILIGAPESLSETFDRYGRPNIDHWTERKSEYPIEGWLIAEDPTHQAELAIQTIAELDREYPAGKISIGVPDHSVTPYIQRKLEQHGITGRDAAGTPISKTKPTLLMDAVGSYLSSKSFSSYVWLLRHPDIQRLLPRKDSAIDDLDEYFNRHFPVRFTGTLHTYPKERGERLRTNYQKIEELLGELTAVQKKPMTDWIAEFKTFLSKVYGDSRLLPHIHETDRVLVETFEQFKIVFEKCSRLPDKALPRMSAVEAISFILQELSSVNIPPDAPKESVPSIELLGWLELALDEAPVLIVTGMNNEIVPSKLNYPGWLPETIRFNLELDRRDRRFARDAYIHEFLVHSKDHLRVISGRRGISGDPLLPSRILLNVEDEHIADHALHAMKPAKRVGYETEHGSKNLIVFQPPIDLERAVPEKLSATAFRTYLESPYMFYLRHILKLRTIDDVGEELDAASFGDIAHDVLEDFGRSEARDSTSLKEICAVLDDGLGRLAKRRFGVNAKPAITLQMEQLRHRLYKFAEQQVTHRNEGWFIHKTESNLSKELFVDGTPITITGRIDRIDRNESTGEWIIFDYKTNNLDPLKAHGVGTKGGWKDLQLPLYWYLREEDMKSDTCRLGYINLAADEAAFNHHSAQEFQAEEGVERAQKVIQDIRSRNWLEMGNPQLYGEFSFRALCGEGLLGGAKIEANHE